MLLLVWFDCLSTLCSGDTKSNLIKRSKGLDPIHSNTTCFFLMLLNLFYSCLTENTLNLYVILLLLLQALRNVVLHNIVWNILNVSDIELHIYFVN